MVDRAAILQILEDTTSVELVDWPHEDVPAALHRAGFSVLGHEPSGYKRYEVVAQAPVDPGEGRVFPLDDGNVLVSRNIDEMPERVDVVVVFRPPAEQPDLLRQAVEAGARVFWVHPGIPTAPDLEDMTTDAGLVFVDGVSITDVVRDLG